MLEIRRGRNDVALEILREAEEMQRRVGPSADLAGVWLWRAEALHASGRHADAVEAAREGLRHRQVASADDALLAPYRWILARARLAAGGDRDAAIALGRRVADTYAAIDGAEPQAREVQAWLDAHRRE